MFPIHVPNVFFLVLTGVALLSALAFSFGWKVRIPLLILALALLSWFWSTLPTSGDHYGLKYPLVLLPSAATFFVGAVWGLFMKKRSFWVSVFVPVIFAGAYAGHVLWRQYLPEACLGKSLQVRVANEVMSFPPEVRSSFETNGAIYAFGSMEHKTSYAQLCRMSSNATQTIDVEALTIWPAAGFSRLTTACEAEDPPDWCGNYSEFPYRHMREVRISSRLGRPEYYWDSSIANERLGSLTEGSICLLPEDGRRTQCWVWQPFGDGLTLAIRTNNLDQIFDDMPVEQARNMTIEALITTLSIVYDPG